jgi:hypothetical protein
MCGRRQRFVRGAFGETSILTIGYGPHNRGSNSNRPIVWFLGKQEVKPPVFGRLFPNINTGDRLQPPDQSGEDNMFKLFRSGSFVGALMFLTSMVLGTSALHAQMVGGFEVNVPFAFHADNTKLPAGEYFIRPVQDTLGDVLEIENASNKISVFVMPVSHETNTLTKTSDLRFDKIGTSYFLRGIREKDSYTGYQLVESRTEERLAQNNMKMESRHLAMKHQKAGIKTS